MSLWMELTHWLRICKDSWQIIQGKILHSSVFGTALKMVLWCGVLKHFLLSVARVVSCKPDDEERASCYSSNLGSRAGSQCLWQTSRTWQFNIQYVKLTKLLYCSVDLWVELEAIFILNHQAGCLMGNRNSSLVRNQDIAFENKC